MHGAAKNVPAMVVMKCSLSLSLSLSRHFQCGGVCVVCGCMYTFIYVHGVLFMEYQWPNVYTLSLMGFGRSSC